jgi:hypothetical protein
MRKTKILLALLVVGSLLLIAATGAVSRNVGTQTMAAKGTSSIDEIYYTIKDTGAKDGHYTFDVKEVAVKTRDGNVAMFKLTKPLVVDYSYSADKFVMPMKGQLMDMSAKPMVTSYDKANIDVAGASAVVALKDIKMLKQEKNMIDLSFGSMSIYLPSGAVKSYTLSTPAKFEGNMQTGTITISGSSAIRPGIQEAVKGMGTFQANAPAVPLSKVDAK